mmetsp:Transcript_13855/g.43379  ORF Transcript_13855/g.43379 Transcript_13855/m.43379 type:complete len:227 (+) Transcript_13855:818-1498(+)
MQLAAVSAEGLRGKAPGRAVQVPLCLCFECRHSLRREEALQDHKAVGPENLEGPGRQRAVLGAARPGVLPATSSNDKLCGQGATAWAVCVKLRPGGLVVGATITEGQHLDTKLPRFVRNKARGKGCSSQAPKAPHWAVAAGAPSTTLNSACCPVQPGQHGEGCPAGLHIGGRQTHQAACCQGCWNARPTPPEAGAPPARPHGTSFAPAGEGEAPGTQCRWQGSQHG